MKNPRMMALLCSLLAWQPSLSVSAMVMHQEAPRSSPRNSRGTVRGLERVQNLNSRNSDTKVTVNPLAKNPSLQNISLIADSYKGIKHLFIPNYDMQAISKTTNSSSTVDDASSSNTKSTGKEKTWERKLQEASESGAIPKNIVEAAKKCSETMAKHWDAWTEGTGTLTIKRIGQLLKDKDITGKQAAALGALADYFYRENRKVSSLRVADHKDAYTLQEVQAALANFTGKGGRNNEALADDYRTALIQIKDDTTKDGFSLYGKLGSPRYGENVQWNVCDCYFVSAVNAVLKKDPQAIKNMIKQTPPDTFEVKFPGYPTPIKIHLTQGDIAMFSHTKDGGCYLAVLGRAADKVMRLEHDDHSKAGNATPLGTMVDAGSHWDETNTFHLLTGKTYAQIPTKHYTTDELKSLIEYAIEHHEIIGLGEAYSPISKHYLIITGFHDGVVDVLNPWGQTRYYSPLGNDPLPFLPDMPKPDAGGGHVFAMHNGHFQVPLKDIVKWGFGSMTFERKDLIAVLGPKKDASKTDDVKKDNDDRSRSNNNNSTDSSSTASTTSAASKSVDDSKKDRDEKRVDAPRNYEESKKEFDRTVQKYWDKWTASSDGKLNIKEIGRLLEDPNITGKEAAALGTLAITLSHNVINKEHKPLASFTEAEVISGSKDSQAAEYFKDAMDQLHGDTSSKGLSLYGKTGHPDWHQVKQWKVGDCWFVSVVDAVLRKYGADYVEKMITQDPNDPNKFTVKFPGQDKPIKVTLTEGEISMFSHTVNDGSWLAVLGMALNTVVEEKRQKENKPEGYRSWYPFGHVVNGGSNLLTYKLFTNKTYVRIPTNKIPEMKAALKWAEDHHDPIGINTHVHDLSIKRIDWGKGMVEIQNPWGTSQVYTTDIKIKMGPDGTFWIPMDELSSDSFIKIEVPVKAKEAAEKELAKNNDSSKTSTSAAKESSKGSAPVANSELAISNEAGDLASLAKKDMSAERRRLDEQMDALNSTDSESASPPAKAMLANIQKSINACRAMEDKLIDSLSANPRVDSSAADQMRKLVADSRTDVDKVVAKLDAKYASEFQALLTDERNVTDHEIQTLTKMAQDFSKNNKGIRLDQGSALIAHQDSLSLSTPNATVNLGTGAIAFVVSLNGSTAVYNLGNNNTITVDPGSGDALVVQSGHALLIASNWQASAENANPLQSVPLSNVKALGLHNNNSCFDAQYAVTAVMDSAPQIAPLFQSKDQQDKQLAAILLKKAAATQMAGQ